MRVRAYSMILLPRSVHKLAEDREVSVGCQFGFQILIFVLSASDRAASGAKGKENGSSLRVVD